MQYLKIGLLIKPHGLKGEIKILPLTDDLERFKKLTKVYLLSSDEYIIEHIVSIKKANHLIIVKFEKYDNRDDVEKLRNTYLFIDRSEGVPLKDGEYYTQDLVDCYFYYNNKKLGKVIDVINEGSCDIFIINYMGNEIFYPFINEYINDIDIKNKKISINFIEGYFD